MKAEEQLLPLFFRIMADEAILYAMAVGKFKYAAASEADYNRKFQRGNGRRAIG